MSNHFSLLNPFRMDQNYKALAEDLWEKWVALNSTLHHSNRTIEGV